jgi:hypothetical protein
MAIAVSPIFERSGGHWGSLPHADMQMSTIVVLRKVGLGRELLRGAVMPTMPFRAK